MATTPIRLATDTTVYQGGNAAKNYAGAPTLVARNTTNAVSYSYILTRGLPSGTGLVVSEAYLRIVPTATYASTTVNLHLVTQSWTSTKVTWNNKPDATTLVGTYTGALTKNVPIDIPITGAVQGWIAGTANNGVRVSSTATVSRSFHSANATGTNAKYAPQLLVTYSLKPAVPTGFALTGNKRTSLARPTTTWVYSNPDSTTMTAYKIQTNSTNVWTTPAYDSGEVASTTPSHTWTSDIALNSVLWYRVQHKSSAGRWSDWSEGQQFGRTAKPTVTVTAPTAAVNTDPTPTTVWTNSGTGTSWRVTIKVVSTGEVLATSGWQPGADTSWAPTTPLSVANGVSLVSVVDVIDNVNRVETPGDTTYATGTSAAFTLGTGSGVNPVTSVAVAAAQVGPAVVLTWSRAAVPDGFVIERVVDGTIRKTFTVDSTDALVAGTSYSWTDSTVPPQHTSSYIVRAVENGNMSAPSSAAVIKPEPIFIWLIDPEDSTFAMPVASANDADFTWEEDSATFNVLGADRTMVIAEGTGRLSGAVAGIFVDGLPGTMEVTARVNRARAYRLRREPTKTWRLVVDTWNLPVIVRNVQIVPQPGAHDIHGVSFEWHAQGELPQDTGY